MKYITYSENPEFPAGLPTDMEFVASGEQPIFAIEDDAVLPAGARLATDAEREIAEQLVALKAAEYDRKEIRREIYSKMDLDSLVGKMGNFCAAIANIQLDQMAKLMAAQTFDEYKQSMSIHIPLMQALQAKFDSGEIISVQSAQHHTDAEAIMEGLEALTGVARIMSAHQAPE